MKSVVNHAVLGEIVYEESFGAAEKACPSTASL